MSREATFLSLSQIQCRAIVEMEGRKYGEVLKDFVQSNAYNCLFGFETGVWREGPAYLESLYRQELSSRCEKGES